DQLIEHEIEPAAELEARLLDRPGTGEAERFMQPHARRSVAVDTSDQGMEVLGGGGVNDLLEQQAAESTPAKRRRDIDRMFDGVFEGRAFAKAAKGPEARKLALFVDHTDHRKVRAFLRRKPRLHD